MTYIAISDNAEVEVVSHAGNDSEALLLLTVAQATEMRDALTKALEGL